MQFFRHRRERGRPPHPDVLTPAEWRVLELVREGLPNAEIAVRLGLGVPTVKMHVSNMLAKLGLPHRYALAAWDGEPAEASRAALGRGFAVPLAGWFTSGAAVTGAKVAGVGAASVVFVAGLFAAFTFFFAEGFFAEGADGESGPGGRFAAPGMVATVNGQEVTEDRWRVALDSVDWQIRFARYTSGDENAEESAARERYVALLESHPPEVVALAGVVLERAMLAEALARGFEPTEEEVAEHAAEQERVEVEMASGELGIEPELATLIEGQRQATIDIVGERRYREEFRPAQLRSTLAVMQFAQAEGAWPPFGGELNFTLARNAEVRLAPALRDIVSVADVMAYLDAYQALSAELEAAQRGAGSGEAAVEATPVPLPPAGPLPGHDLDVRTGEAWVDAVIDAVLAGDADTLRTLARFEEHACALVTENDWRGLPPSCPEGVAEGSPVAVMGIAACHGGFIHEDSANFDWGFDEARLYAVSAAAPRQDSAGEYLAVFATRMGASGGIAGFGLELGRGGFTGIVGGCGHSLDDFQRVFGAGEPYLLAPPGS